MCGVLYTLPSEISTIYEVDGKQQFLTSGREDADDDVANRVRSTKPFREIMERKHGFNCNIMHESLFNDAKGMETIALNARYSS